MKHRSGEWTCRLGAFAVASVSIALCAPPPAPGPPAPPVKLVRLVAAYPDFLVPSAERNAVVFRDGTRMVFDDGREKVDLEALLADPDLEDQMLFAYPLGPLASPPGVDSDPGRVRCDAFFKKMYGRSAGAVSANLASVVWLPSHGGRRISITRVNGVHRHLEAVSRELDRLGPDLIRYVDRPGGTFNWRTIASTDRLSPHSFGIAIDINTDRADYWEWQKGRKGGAPKYRNRIPQAIVDVFEKHGFIWGGKWYHYDTMHFEYRPELIPDRTAR